MLRAILLPSLVLILAPVMARADGADPAAADVLFREGRRAADAGNYALACPKFEESFRLDPAPGTLLNLGDCEENRGQLTRAWQHFQQLTDQLPATDERRPIAIARARALEARAPKLRIVLAVTGPATVVRDGVALGGPSLGTSLPVDPGRHVIVVSALGRRDRRYEVDVGEREDKEVSVSTGETIPELKRPMVVVTEPRTPDIEAPVASPPVRDGHAQRTAAFVLGSTGVAGLLMGGIFGGVALAHLSSANAGCTGNVCANQDALSQFHSAQSFAIAADVTISFGVALLGTAVVLYLTSPHAHHAQTAVPLWLGGRF